MTRFKLRALFGATALMGATIASASAHAATIQGGGSSLLAPYWQQAAYCYDNDAANKSFYVKGIPVTSTTITPYSGTGCPNNTGNLIRYDSTGSGTGQEGVFAHTGTIKDASGNLLFGSTDTGGATQLFTTIQYGLSDNSLTDADLGVYNAGTSDSTHTITYTFAFNGNTATVTNPNAYQGVTFDPNATVSGTNYAVPKPIYGALVQFPVSVDPVALPYNPTYVTGGVTKSFTITTTDGNLHLDQNAYCRIFNGDITNWNDSQLTALNHPDGSTTTTSLTGGVSVPITRIGRSDSSGTTSILTRHLASAACTSNSHLGSADKYTVGTTTIPSGAQSLFTLPGGASGSGLVSGSGGVASTVQSTNASIGYVGPDYVLPASNNTGVGSTVIKAASLLQGSTYLQPNQTSANAAFNSINPPQSNAMTGAYNSGDMSTDRRDPTQWVQSTAATAALANPTATGAYPITGTTNFLGYTCYASSASVTLLTNFLGFAGNPSTTAPAYNILSKAGLSQLPTKWLNAIAGTFFYSTATGNASSLNLFIDYKGHTGTGSNSLCQASGIVGA